jgi:hypothetical protein
MIKLMLTAYLSFSRTFFTQNITQREQLMQYYGTLRGYKYLRVIEMVSSGGAMFLKYFTHKSHLQIAGFHRTCAAVNLHNDANPGLGTICDKRRQLVT